MLLSKFFRLPFGVSGDITAIPNDAQIDASVSYEEGYTYDYQRHLSDPLRKDVERDKQNSLFYEITRAIRQYQTEGFPEFIESADNDGSPYSYGFNAYVRYDAGSGYDIYRSIVNANTSLPTDDTKWERLRYGQFPSGSVLEYYGSTLPDGGWLWLNGQTIGSASSGGTARANADTLTLYTTLWTSIPNSLLPIQDSTGAATTRGASAAADFAANKRLPLPDKRGRVAAGKDDMGGISAAGRLTLERPQGVTGNVLGAFGGQQSHLLNTAEIPNHSHYIPSWRQANIDITGGHAAVGVDSGAGGGPQSDTAMISFGTGGDEMHNNIQPTIISNFIIKL